jgi:co-chaperonin GroES (HSP10)
MIQPIANHYVVKLAGVFKSDAGLYIPQGENKDRWEVVDRGNGEMADGKIEVMYANPGDIVYLADPKAIREIVLGTDKIYIISNHNIMAVEKKVEDV